jgi:hypothetical protein
MAWKYRTFAQRGFQIPGYEFSPAEQRSIFKISTEKQKLAAAKRFAADDDYENALEMLNLIRYKNLPTLKSMFEMRMRELAHG